MSKTPAQRRRRQLLRLRGWLTLARLRIGSGLVIMAFVTSHYLNHALGNISLEAMEWGGQWFRVVWRGPPGTLLFYGALLLHVGCAVVGLLRRRSLRMPSVEAVQMLLGFAVPLLLAAHVVGTRGAHEILGVRDSYTYVVLSIWVFTPGQGVLQSLGLLAAWGHGAAGVHFWLRLKAWYPRWQPWLFTLALLVPAAALAGLAGAGKEAALLARNPDWLSEQVAAMRIPPGTADWVYGMAERIQFGTIVTVALILGVHGIRALRRRRGSKIAVTYPDGRTVPLPDGGTVLDASRAGGIPHALVCGGRGRCSTCRIRIVDGDDGLPAPSDEEVRVLQRVGLPDGVRLACQLRPSASLSVVPLLEAGAQPHAGLRRPGYLQGSERNIAVLFADLRAFTALSETKLPYDVVFLLNQYFRTMGEAVEKADGRLDKFIGDGVMALFGIRRGAAHGCHSAVRAAREMALGLERLNKQLANDLETPLRMGIGVHAGPAIVGEMGYRDVVSVTAVGDTVNTASRLEALSKEYGVQLVLSQEVAGMAGLATDAYAVEQVSLRGRATPMEVLLVPDATKLVLADRPVVQPRPSAPAKAD